MVLAMRAVSMAAGAWHKYLAVTLAALHQHFLTEHGAASFYGRQCLMLAWQHRLMVLCQAFILEGFDDRRQQNHLTVLHLMKKPLINSLMSCVALRPELEDRCVYFAVVRIE